MVISGNTITGSTGKGLECNMDIGSFTGNTISGNVGVSRFCNFDPLMPVTGNTYGDSTEFYDVFGFSIQ